MSNFVDTNAFEKAVIKYKNKPTIKLGQKIAGHLLKMIENMESYTNVSSGAGIIKPITEEDVLMQKTFENKKDCLIHLLENIEKYDENKGRAFNYFVTILMNYIRKAYQKRKKEVELREKYAEIICPILNCGTPGNLNAK